MAMTIKQLGHLYLESGDYEKAAANMLLADRLWFEIESPRQADVEPYLRHLLSLLGSARFGAIAENIRSIGERDSDL